MIAIYPGSFDPITFGHLDVIARAAQMFECVVVAVAINHQKQPLFTVGQRILQIQTAIAHLTNVEVDSFTGLTVSYARQKQAKVLIRGLRAVSDFELELQMAHTNKTLAEEIETIFLTTAKEYSFLSSSVVKEIARYGAPCEHLVPPEVAIALREYFQNLGKS